MITIICLKNQRSIILLVFYGNFFLTGQILYLTESGKGYAEIKVARGKSETEVCEKI